jgi:hypothetical protein
VSEADPVSPTQSRAAHAYARTILAPEIAGPAAEDALAAFRQTLAARGESERGPGSPSANEILLALTRLMTAVSVPDRSSPEDRRQAVLASIGAGSHCTCRESAALLATRTNGNIHPRESAALEEHLAGCADCRELSLTSVAADAAFLQELTPPAGGGGGFSIPSVLGAYATVAVLVAAGFGIYALTRGGSSLHASHAAAATPVPTRTAASINLPITTATVAAKPAVAPPHAAKKPKLQPRTVTHTTTTQTATRSASSTTGGASASAGATGDSGAAAAPGTAAASPSPAATGGSGTPGASASTTAPSSAAVVSGQSSLPADSAPQQGIGNLTATTP